MLASIDLEHGRAGDPRPKMFTRLLEQAATALMPRWSTSWCCAARAQAVYSPGNIGHFGLALGALCAFHLADPALRRPAGASRADLGLRLEGGGSPAAATTGTSSAHGRRAASDGMEAERTAHNRFTALLLAERIGSAFDATVTGVQRFGLFVQLTDTLAEGLVPVAVIGHEFFVHDPGRYALIGQGERAPRSRWATACGRADTRPSGAAGEPTFACSTTRRGRRAPPPRAPGASGRAARGGWCAAGCGASRGTGPRRALLDRGSAGPYLVANLNRREGRHLAMAKPNSG